MGAPQPARRAAPPRAAPLADRLLRALPGVDVRIVADRAQRPKEDAMTIVLVVARPSLRSSRPPAAACGRARHPRAGATAPRPAARRILFPFVGRALSQPRARRRAAARRAEDATLVAAYLAPGAAAPAARRRAAARVRARAAAAGGRSSSAPRRAGVPVDSRIERGRTYRHALRELIAHERYDQIVVAAAPEGARGFTAEDVAWLLHRAPGEIVVLRPEGRGAARRAVPAAA